MDDPVALAVARSVAQLVTVGRQVAVAGEVGSLKPIEVGILLQPPCECRFVVKRLLVPEVLAGVLGPEVGDAGMQSPSRCEVEHLAVDDVPGQTGLEHGEGPAVGTHCAVAEGNVPVDLGRHQGSGRVVVRTVERGALVEAPVTPAPGAQVRRQFPTAVEVPFVVVHELMGVRQGERPAAYGVDGRILDLLIFLFLGEFFGLGANEFYEVVTEHRLPETGHERVQAAVRDELAHLPGPVPALVTAEDRAEGHQVLAVVGDRAGPQTVVQLPGVPEQAAEDPLAPVQTVDQVLVRQIGGEDRPRVRCPPRLVRNSGRGREALGSARCSLPVLITVGFESLLPRLPRVVV